jgi:hypothetical protein
LGTVGGGHFAFKVASLDDGRPGTFGWNGLNGKAFETNMSFLGKQSAQGEITDTLWFKKEGYASKKIRLNVYRPENERVR